MTRQPLVLCATPHIDRNANIVANQHFQFIQFYLSMNEPNIYVHSKFDKQSGFVCVIY